MAWAWTTDPFHPDQDTDWEHETQEEHRNWSIQYYHYSEVNRLLGAAARRTAQRVMANQEAGGNQRGPTPAAAAAASGSTLDARQPGSAAAAGPTDGHIGGVNPGGAAAGAGADGMATGGPSWLLYMSTPTRELPDATRQQLRDACADGDAALVCADGVQLRAHAQLLALHSPLLKQQLQAATQAVTQAAMPPSASPTASTSAEPGASSGSGGVASGAGEAGPAASNSTSPHVIVPVLLGPHDSSLGRGAMPRPPANHTLSTTPPGGSSSAASSTTGLAHSAQQQLLPQPQQQPQQEQQLLLLVVPEASAEWELLLSAVYLPECEDVFSIEHAHTLARLARKYGMRRVLKLIADCVIVAGPDWQVVFESRRSNVPRAVRVGNRARSARVVLDSGSGGLYLPPDQAGGRDGQQEREAYLSISCIQNPRHVLQLLHLAQGTGHPLAIACVLELLQLHSASLCQIFQGADFQEFPEITQEVGRALLAACMPSIRRRLPSYRSHRSAQHDDEHYQLRKRLDPADWELPIQKTLTVDYSSGSGGRAGSAVPAPLLVDTRLRGMAAAGNGTDPVACSDTGSSSSSASGGGSSSGYRYAQSVGPAGGAGPAAAAPAAALPPPPPPGQAELLAMTADGDIILSCQRDGVGVRAHTCVLRQQSEVLRAMLSPDCGVAGSSAAPACLSVDDHSRRWLAALAVMYPLDDDGACPARMVHEVLELADKYDMVGVKRRVMAHWSSHKNLAAMLKQGMSTSKMEDALRLLSLCASESLENGTRLCSCLLDDHIDLFFRVMVDRGGAAAAAVLGGIGAADTSHVGGGPAAPSPPVLSPAAWWLVLKKVTEKARGW